jgi:hypothetical protein
VPTSNRINSILQHENYENIIKYILGLLLALFLLTGCNRFLDEKSDTTLAVPMTLEDNQALLDRLQMYLPTLHRVAWLQVTIFIYQMQTITL